MGIERKGTSAETIVFSGRTHQQIQLYHSDIEVLFCPGTARFLLSRSESAGSPQVWEAIQAHTINEASE